MAPGSFMNLSMVSGSYCAIIVVKISNQLADKVTIFFYAVYHSEYIAQFVLNNSYIFFLFQMTYVCSQKSLNSNDM